MNLFVAVFFIFFGLVNCTHVTLITIVIGQNPMYGLNSSGPVFDVALQTVAAMYPDIFCNVTQHIVYKPKAISGCGDTGDMMFSVAAEVFQLIEQSKGFPVILSPGCSLEIITLGDFARELDVPLLTSTSGDASLADRGRYPTLTTFSPAGQGLTAIAIRQFLRRNSWKVVTVLCDELSLFPSAATVYIILCRSLKAALTENTGEFQLYYESYDSKNQPDYSRMLLRAKEQSRIIIIATNSNVMRRIMVIAHRLNMTNGDHAFLYPEAMRVPQTSQLQLKGNDGLDEELVFQALKSVIMFRFPFPDWDRLEPYTLSVRKRALEFYNYSYAPDEYQNDATLSAYEAVIVLAQVLNETWSNLEHLPGRVFSDRIAGRSYDLGFQIVDIGRNGMRFRDTWILMFNAVSKTFVITWYHQWVNNNISVVSKVMAHNWYGSAQLPPDVPACGFRNELCRFRNSFDLSVILPPVIIIVSLIITAGIIGGIWRYKFLQVHYSTWWKLDAERLKVLYRTVSGKFRSQDELPKDNSSMHGLDPITPAVFYEYGHDRIWMQEKTTTTALNANQLSSNKLFRNTVAEVRLLSHENVGVFMGVILFSQSLSLIWQCGRGSVRSLLDENKIRLDRPLQLSLIIDLLRGLRYIHSSRLSYHGSLTTANIMLDSRFTIKISAHASTRIFRCTGCRDDDLQTQTNLLWMAPEQILTATHEGSRAADIYAAGIAALEILTSATPYDVNRDDPISLTLALAKLKCQPELPRFDMDRWSFPPPVLAIFSYCLSSEERLRPNVQDFLQMWKSFDPHTNIMQNFIQRLQAYSEELEDLVGSRTAELLAETEKVDLLLSEMIPGIFVSKLRNKEQIPVEKFDLVTILFSSLMGFETFCASSTAFAVVKLLNKLYIIFDAVIQRYDVYKVETIRDGYMVASGLPIRNGNRHVYEIALAAIGLLTTGQMDASLFRTDIEHLTLQVRIGIHSGPCAAGVVGTRMPRYCLFGDTINTASRMESHGVAMKIQISNSTRMLLSEHAGNFLIESRGMIEIKGKGSAETFFLSAA